METGGLLSVPQTLSLMQAPLSPDVLNTWCIRQEQKTICPTWGGHKEREIKPSRTKEEISKKAELVITARTGFVYNGEAEG